MKSMKSIMSAGLCLVAMLVVSMVAAGSASAAPHWLVCLPEHSGTTTTKWTTHQCKTAGTGGGWEWSELKGTEAAVSHASLTLTDTKVLGKRVTVTCTGKDEGSVGPGKFDRITSITEISCKAGENCEKLEENAKPLHLPWQTELVESPAGSGKIRDKITSGGNGAPGWAVKCKVILVKTDECTSEEGSVGLENRLTENPHNELELLVLGDFDENSKNANCTVGGEGAGEVRGTVALLLANGWALRATL